MIRFAISLILICLLTMIAWNANGQSWFGIDDANIYFVYMKHLAEGHGFVYAIGGEKVEGFTSLLWTLLGSGIYALGLQLEYVLIGVNIIVISTVLSRLWKYCDEIYQSPSILNPHSLILLGIVCTAPGFIEWNILSLLETGVWTTLLTHCTLNIIKGRKQTWGLLLYILLVMCRPEALLWGIALAAIPLILKLLKNESIKVMDSAPMIIVLCTVIAMIMWRLSYFGYPLPNTFYAKVSSDFIANALSGIKYDAKFFIGFPIMILLFGLMIYHGISFIKQQSIEPEQSRSRSIILISVGLISLLIPLYSGGDHFNLFRFFQSSLPLVILYFVLFPSKSIKELSYLHAILFIIFSMIGSQWLIYSVKAKTPLQHEWHIALEGREQSKALQEFFHNDKLPTQGVLVAGGTAYSYSGTTIDLLGLNNTKMAHADKVKTSGLMKNHASFNKQVFYELSPDIFWIGGYFSKKKQQVLVLPSFNTKVFKNIHADNEFRTYYGAFTISNDNNTWLTTVCSRRFIAGLDTAYYHVYEIALK